MLHDFLALMYSMAGVHVSKCDRLNGAPIPRGMKGRTVHFGWPMDLVLKESHFDEILVCPPPTTHLWAHTLVVYQRMPQ